MFQEIFTFQVLNAAVDFLFGEAKALMAERRTVRQAAREAAAKEAERPAATAGNDAGEGSAAAETEVPQTQPAADSNDGGEVAPVDAALATQDATAPGDAAAPPATGRSTADVLLARNREEVLQTKVSATLAEQELATVAALLDEIAIYQRNRQRLQRRVALEGGADYAPISVLNQLASQEEALLRISEQLAAIVGGLMDASDAG